MKRAAILSAALLAASFSSHAADVADHSASAQVSDIGTFCFFAGMPPADIKYRVVKKIKLGKGTYGSVKDILPALADRARKAGADAIIGYAGSQRFGFFPWRMVRPVARGTAVQWSDQSETKDCTAIGGTTLNTILETDKAPAS